MLVQEPSASASVVALQPPGTSAATAMSESGQPLSNSSSLQHTGAKPAPPSPRSVKQELQYYEGRQATHCINKCHKTFHICDLSLMCKIKQRVGIHRRPNRGGPIGGHIIPNRGCLCGTRQHSGLMHGDYLLVLASDMCGMHRPRTPYMHICLIPCPT